MDTNRQRIRITEADLDRANSDSVRLNHAHSERARVLSRAQRQQQLIAQNDIKFLASIEHANAVIDAYAAGCEHGKQSDENGGYTSDWYWGLCCGAVGGALAMAAIMLARAWLALHAS